MTDRIIKLSSYPVLAKANSEDEIMKKLKKALTQLVREAGGTRVDFKPEADAIRVTFTSKKVAEIVAAKFNSSGVVLEPISDVDAFFTMLKAAEAPK